MLVIRELCVWEFADRPRDEVVFGTRWVDINKGDENKPFCSRLVAQDYKRQADWSFFTAIPPLEALRSLLICATIEELSSDVGQPVAWTERVVSDVYRSALGTFCSAAWRKVFVELPAQCWTFAQEYVWLSRRWSELGAICQVMIAIGLCKVEHLEKQLRVWVHGDDFVPLGYIINVKWFSSEAARVLDCHEWRNPWTLWTDDDGPGKHIFDMLSSSGNRSELPADQLRHLESETSSMTLKERLGLTRRRQIGVVQTLCVHSISPVTDLRYKSSAGIWHARCNSRRIWMKWD